MNLRELIQALSAIANPETIEVRTLDLQPVVDFVLIRKTMSVSGSLGSSLVFLGDGLTPLSGEVQGICENCGCFRLLSPPCTCGSHARVLSAYEAFRRFIDSQPEKPIEERFGIHCAVDPDPTVDSPRR